MSHANERLPTSTVKEHILLLTELKTWDSVQSDPRVVFSVADVLACHRETRWYCTQITLALSSLLQTLACHQQTRAIDGSQLTRSHRLLLCSRSSLSSADSTVRQFQLTLALCSPFAQLRRSPLLNVFSRTLPCPFSFLLQAISRHCLMQSSTHCIARIRVDTCAHDGMPAGQPASQGHHRNVCVWTSRLSGAHYRPETATLPEICRLLLAKLCLRSNNCFKASKTIFTKHTLHCRKDGKVIQ